MRLGWRSHLADVHRDDDFAIEQAAFLGRDLGITSLLRSRTSVAFANVFEPVEVGACILESSRSPFRVAWTSIAPWRWSRASDAITSRWRRSPSFVRFVAGGGLLRKRPRTRGQGSLALARPRHPGLDGMPGWRPRSGACSRSCSMNGW